MPGSFMPARAVLLHHFACNPVSASAPAFSALCAAIAPSINTSRQVLLLPLRKIVSCTGDFITQLHVTATAAARGRLAMLAECGSSCRLCCALSLGCPTSGSACRCICGPCCCSCPGGSFPSTFCARAWLLLLLLVALVLAASCILASSCSFSSRTSRPAPDTLLCCCQCCELPLNLSQLLLKLLPPGILLSSSSCSRSRSCIPCLPSRCKLLTLRMLLLQVEVCQGIHMEHAHRGVCHLRAAQPHHARLPLQP